jgi:hypothetical protein
MLSTFFHLLDRVMFEISHDALVRESFNGFFHDSKHQASKVFIKIPTQTSTKISLNIHQKASKENSLEIL